jgi:hypothetical protein
VFSIAKHRLWSNHRTASWQGRNHKGLHVVVQNCQGAYGPRGVRDHIARTATGTPTGRGARPYRKDAYEGEEREGGLEVKNVKAT